MKIIIAGGGETGEALASLLLKEKNQVILIEKNDRRARALADKLSALVLKGNAAHRKILKDAGIDRCDALAALTGDDRTNLSICRTAKEFKVRVVSRVSDERNEREFRKLGIPAINTRGLVSLAIKSALEKPIT